MEGGESPDNVRNVLRATGWPQVNGKDISDESYTGLLTISVFQMQDKIRKSSRLNVSECRAQLWDMARSFVMTCLATGQLKYVADGLKVMGASLQIEPPKKKPREVPNQAKGPEFENLSTEELQRIATRSSV